MTRWGWAGLALWGALGLGGCSESPAGAVTCALLGATVGVDEVVVDREVGLRCVCMADGEGRCEPLTDMGAEAPDRGGLADQAVDMAPPRDMAPVPDEGPEPDQGPRPDDGPEPDQGPEPDEGPEPDMAPDPDMGPEPDMAPPEPECEAGQPVCVGGERFTCTAAGRLGPADPCPAGELCALGGCVAATPDVMLLVDTSSSMDTAVADGEAEAFPICESADAPFTQLGRVKAALEALFQTDAVDQVRLGLAHMPTDFTRTFDCPEGYYRQRRVWPSFSVDPQTYSDPDYMQVRDGVIGVPWVPEGGTDVAGLLSWVDEAEVFEPNGLACDDPACYGACNRDNCLTHTDPELRSVGDSVFGKALFIAATYVEKEVLSAGVECGACPEPYACVGGTCQDPLGDCRQRAVIVFMDGPEVEDFDETQSYFAPTVQAKRLRYGLGCAVDEDCLGVAVCDTGRCRAGRCTTDPSLACGERADCPDGGRCTLRDLNYGGAETAWVIREPDGRPARMTVHVIDASGTNAGADLAHWGEGLHVVVDDYDVGNLLAAYQTVIAEVRARTARCLEAR
ncbi:MAG: hypothetical protein KC613_09910 [Myxococcales bacterium]|nr:hypothetical protein [Myxococcales bacterium]MCB9524063.1 hypothetical protein [Myxococcales bacterium]